MRTRTITLITIACVTLGACANDQSDVADEMVKQAADADLTLDKDCVSKLAEGLSDDDVKSLEEGSDQVTSPEGAALLARMGTECADREQVIDLVLSGLPDDGSVDKDCVAEALEDVDLAALQAGTDPALQQAMLDCVTGG